MAIQYRRGKWSDFDPAKLKPGEAALILLNDPASSDGKSVYFCFAAGNVKRMATYDDMKDDIENATSEIQSQYTQEIEQTLEDAKTQIAKIEDATTNANNAALQANQAASSAQQATAAFEQAVEGTVINDNTPSLNTTYSSQKISQLLESFEIPENVLTTNDLSNSLTSGEPDKALTAQMGKQLNDNKIEVDSPIAFTTPSTRSLPSSGDHLNTLFGKMRKYFLDLGESAFLDEKDIVDLIYPVGSIYMSVKSTSPATLFGGTWVRWGNGRVPVGVDASQKEFNSVEKIGGEKTHRLTEDEMPAHQHFADNNDGEQKLTGNIGNMGFSAGSDEGAGNCYGLNWAYRSRRTDTGIKTAAAGGGDPHNNLQPYITCYMWKRTA